MDTMEDASIVNFSAVSHKTLCKCFFDLIHSTNSDYVGPKQNESTKWMMVKETSEFSRVNRICGICFFSYLFLTSLLCQRIKNVSLPVLIQLLPKKKGD